MVARAPLLLKILLGFVAVVLVLAAADAVWLGWIWPDWKPIARGPVPASRFLRDWERSSRRKARWMPVPLSTIPAGALRAVLVAEDSNFWQHGGFDGEAFKEAMSENVARRRIAFGASTISQQTTKNLFLSSSRTPLRKWHELVLTWGLERNVSKRRILEIYVNDAELGLGLFGFEAAAQNYFSAPASTLTMEQAIELAATLPSPRKDNPSTRTARFDHRVAKIRRWLDLAGALATATPEASPVADETVEESVHDAMVDGTSE